jgi:hypothetical protein
MADTPEEDGVTITIKTKEELKSRILDTIAKEMQASGATPAGPMYTKSSFMAGYGKN